MSIAPPEISPAPRHRTDLVFSDQPSGDGPAACVVKDPASGRFFRFGPVESFILRQFDGCNPLEMVQERTEQRFGARLPPATLEQFTRRLHGLGLLDTGQARGGSAPAGQRRWRGNLFHLRLPLVDPDRFFDRVVGPLRFLFTPGFVVLSALVVAAAVLVTAANWDEIALDLPRLFNGMSLGLAYVTVLVVIALHECAHGLTCKAFGGSVREMGFLLLLFQPAFYCNVSDAWLFPRKSHRLWVTFAGAYFEVFVWALATLAWRLTEPWTAVNHLALVVMTTSGVKTLFNLNPLIKLDGYYLLSDSLGIPNLRQRAFAHLGRAWGRLWGGGRDGDAGNEELTLRERRVFAAYGVLAWVYSAWLLTVVFSHLGGWLVRRYQGWGFAFLLLLLGGVFQQPMRKLLRAAMPDFSIRDRMNRAWKWSLRLAVLAAVGAALWLVRADLRVAGPFLVLPIHNADVRAGVDGVLDRIHVEEGDTVKAGDRVASLNDRDCRAELRKVQAEIDEQQARLNLLHAGSRPEELELARTITAKAEERLKYARTRLETDQGLFQQLLVSRKQLDEARELVAVREKELQESLDQLKLLLAGSRKELIEATAAELARLRAHKQYLEEQLGLLQITSPAGGVIITPKLKDKAGQAVRKGDLVAKVHEMNTVSVEIAVAESDIGDVAVGQKVVLKARAHPHVSLEGRVTAIAPVASQPEDPRLPRTVRVTTQLDNRAGLLKPEMTGHAKIHGAEQRLGQLISRRFVRFIKVEFWSWW